MSTPSITGFEKLTVSSAAVGFASTHIPGGALVAVESAAIRYRVDGTAPTSTDGVPVQAGEKFVVPNNAAAFKAIRSGSSDATLQIVFFDGPVDGTIGTATAVTVSTSDIEIGAVELKNATDDTRAKIGALSGLASSDNGLGVTDPVANAVLGVTTGTKVITDANGTLQQYLRGLVHLWITGGLGVKEARASTAVVTSVNDQATSTTLLAANAARLGCRIVNDSTSVLYAKFGVTATTTDYSHKLLAGETLFENEYTGRIDGIWSADASGAARITELTA